jgi:hypothetical protein
VQRFQRLLADGVNSPSASSKAACGNTVAGSGTSSIKRLASPGRGLAQLTWAHYGNELVKAETDRAALAALMAALLDEDPALATERTRALLRSVRATLVPGMVEGHLDRLVEAHGHWPTCGPWPL